MTIEWRLLSLKTFAVKFLVSNIAWQITVFHPTICSNGTTSYPPLTPPPNPSLFFLHTDQAHFLKDKGVHQMRVSTHLKDKD